MVDDKVIIEARKAYKAIKCPGCGSVSKVKVPKTSPYVSHREKWQCRVCSTVYDDDGNIVE
jgi:transposase-like protein